MKTAIDTNALLALLYDDSYAEASETEIRRAYQDGQLVVSPIVYAELAVDGQFEGRSELDQFLEDFSIRVVEPSRDALFLAGEQFQRYAGNRPAGLQCPSCGTKQTIQCDGCGESLAPRQHIAADFVIGGHAVADATALISFDTNFYQTYFPSLTVHPQSNA